MMTSPTADVAALRALWTESERKLYPLATVNPEKYERLVLVAREVANDLGVVETHDGLAAHWQQSTAIVRAASTRADLPLGDLPELDVAGVAFALRDAEIRALEHHRKMAQAIGSAAERGDEWVLLHETGTLGQGLIEPYSAIEMHLGTGAAIVSSVEPNPATGRANHVLTVIRLDPATGDPVDLDPGIAAIEEHDDADTFSAARVELVARVAAHTEGEPS